MEKDSGEDKKIKTVQEVSLFFAVKRIDSTFCKFVPGLY